MSDLPVNRGETGLASQPGSNDGVTAGTLLRRAREASGMHVAALAVSLKVPVRKLEALEEDRHDLLTDAVFVRALASTVCRTLRIDPQPIMMRLPQSSAPRLMRDIDGINAPFRSPSDGAAPTWINQLNRPVVLAVSGLLLGALVLILLPAPKDVAPASPSTGTGVVQPTVEPLSSTSAAETIQEPAQGVTAALTTPQLARDIVQVSAGSATPSQPLVAAVVLAAPSAVASAAVPVADAPAGPASGVVVFRAKGESWVEVTDAKGAIALRKTLAPGEAAGASGALPLQVTIGRVDATDVQVRGKQFDLRAVSKDNVARFEVK
jgi:cytoskeleton protein RodZ